MDLTQAMIGRVAWVILNVHYVYLMFNIKALDDLITLARAYILTRTIFPIWWYARGVLLVTDLPLKAGKTIKQQYTIPCLLEWPKLRILTTPNVGKGGEQ